jgi:hypothetical protein
VVEWGCLLSSYTRKGIAGSNPVLPAAKTIRSFASETPTKALWSVFLLRTMYEAVRVDASLCSALAMRGAFLLGGCWAA